MIRASARTLLPVEIVLHPSWWHKHAGISFDRDFFYHPVRRVEVEQEMEKVLRDRFGRYGLWADARRRPVIGAVHNAAGYLVSEMLGCAVEYMEDSAPQVICANRELGEIDVDGAFNSPAFKRFERLCESLKESYGYLEGDANWSGVLNLALDLWGQGLFLEMLERPDLVHRCLNQIGDVIHRFTSGICAETGTTSISVNRTVRHLEPAVFLHSACSLTMLPEHLYEEFLLPLDVLWSQEHDAFGIHYCGTDPHRFAKVFARLPRLAFLDVGWGGNVAALRAALPETFLNIRLSPVEIVHQSPDSIRRLVRDLVRQSGNPWLTGVCCINLDDTVGDETIGAVFEAVAELRAEVPAKGEKTN